MWLCLLLLIYVNCVTSAKHGPTTEAQPEEWTVCLEELGCLNTTADWYCGLRPTNPLPDKRHTIKTSFLIHTKESKPEGDLLPVLAQSLNVSGFQKDKDTIFLIHDFTSNGYTGWIRHLSGVLLNKTDANILAVDWEEGALPPFPKATSNARVVALEIVYLIRMLMDHFDTQPKNIHMIGHGLGAHIAGYVGHSIKGMARITGLDPTGPYFQGMPTEVRLDPTDAEFVDVIHTDMTTTDALTDIAQGTSDLSGHVDFFPNGGTEQPGCVRSTEYPSLFKLTRESLKPGTIYPGCSHKRAFKYFIESIITHNCYFKSYECPSYPLYVQGECEARSYSVLGLDAPQHRPSLPGKFYLTTAQSPPFCLFPYRVKLQLAKPKTARNQVEGNLVLSIMNENVPPITMALSNHSMKVVLMHGETYLVTGYHTAPLVNPIEKAELAWSFHSWLCLFCNENLYVKRLIIKSPGKLPNDNTTTSTLCSCDGKPIAEIKSNSTQVFIPCITENSGQPA